MGNVRVPISGRLSRDNISLTVWVSHNIMNRAVDDSLALLHALARDCAVDAASRGLSTDCDASSDGDGDGGVYASSHPRGSSRPTHLN